MHLYIYLNNRRELLLPRGMGYFAVLYYPLILSVQLYICFLSLTCFDTPEKLSSCEKATIALLVKPALLECICVSVGGKQTNY